MKEEECGRSKKFETCMGLGLFFWWVILFLGSCRASIWIFTVLTNMQ